MRSLSSNPALGHITTFGGHPVSCAAGLASIDYITGNDLVKKASRAGEKFRELLVHNKIRNVRGKGLLMAVELDDPEKARKVVSGCIEGGVITEWFLFNENCLRISPPLIISDSEIEEACSILLESVNRL